LFYRGLGSQQKDAATQLAFGHDATTLSGSSGSLLYAFKDVGTPAFGLHFAGFNNDSNYAIQMPRMKQAFQTRDIALP
jgi:serine protease